MMRRLFFIGSFFIAAGLRAQTCPNASTFNPCELVFDAAREVTLDAELRSPTFATIKMPGFWNGKQMVVRFAPTEPGAWTFRTTSSDAALNGKIGEFAAADSMSPGFLQVDNTRAWSYTLRKIASPARVPHLWMGFQCPQCLTMDRAAFDGLAANRAAQKFSHATVTLAGLDAKALDDAAARVGVLHAKGIFTDVQFAPTAAALKEKLPTATAREAFVRAAVARFAAHRITWQGLAEWEAGTGGRELLKELGELLKKYDPYKHPRSTGAASSSSALVADGWMTHIVSSIADDNLGALEAQVFAAPRIAAERLKPGQNFAERLWNATMNGQYPSFEIAGDRDAKMMSDWYELISRTRYWETEPHYDVDGARALYLTGKEHIVFITQPGTVDVLTENKGFNVYWMNVASGQITKEKKDYKGQRWTGKAPGPGMWVLHLSRDEDKAGMLKSYHFESRRVLYQEVESNLARVPFELAAPAGDTLPVGKAMPFEIKVTRESRGTRQMMYLLTAESAVDGQGARVVALGAKGELTLPENLALNYPAVVNLHLLGINANGKVYSVDKVIRVTK